MFVPVSIFPTQLTRVKTELTFTAEDPWNGDRRETFLLEDYVVTLRGDNSVSQAALKGRWIGSFHRALRCEANGVTRFLPDSLIELWLTHQVSTEALPSLLKRIEPQLKMTDYRPILRSRKMKVFAIVETVICMALVSIATVFAVLVQVTLPLGIAIVLGTAVMCGGFLYVVYFRMLLRRKRQMRWLQDCIHSGRKSNAV